jgi:hypothetical protein
MLALQKVATIRKKGTTLSKYIARLAALLTAICTLGFIALGTTGAANAAVATVPSGSGAFVVTTNNGVAGYYVNNAGAFEYRNLEYTITPETAANNMVIGEDGIGGQVCSSTTGEVDGAGLERIGFDSYAVFFGTGTLHGDAGALLDGRLDSNDCLGGILPTAATHELPLSTSIDQGDTVQILTSIYSVKLGHSTRWRVKWDVTDLNTGDTAEHVAAIGADAPDFNQDGVGSQRSIGSLSAPSELTNVLATFGDVTVAPVKGFNAFGCIDKAGVASTTEVNSSASSNPDGAPGVEPNPFAQLDPQLSLSGGCTPGGIFSTGASFSLYEGNPNS